MTDLTLDPSTNRKPGDDTEPSDSVTTDVAEEEIPQDVLDLIAEVYANPAAYEADGINPEIPDASEETSLAFDALAADDEFTGTSTKSELLRLQRARLGYGAYEGIAGKDRGYDNSVDDFDETVFLLDQLDTINQKIKELEELLDLLEEKKQVDAKLEQVEKEIESVQTEKIALVQEDKQIDTAIAANKEEAKDLKQKADEQGLIMRPHEINGVAAMYAVHQGAGGKYYIDTPDKGRVELNEQDAASIKQEIDAGGTVASEQAELAQKIKACNGKGCLLEARKLEITDKIKSVDQRLGDLSSEKEKLDLQSANLDKRIQEIKINHGLGKVSNDELPEKVKAEIEGLKLQKAAIKEKIGLNEDSTKAYGQVRTSALELSTLLNSPETKPGAEKPIFDEDDFKKKMGDLHATETSSSALYDKNKTTSAEIDKGITTRALAAITDHQAASTLYEQAKTDLSSAENSLKDIVKTRDSLVSESKALADTSKMITEVQTAIKGFEGTRADYVTAAYGGAVKFHAMNAAALLLGGPKPQLVKTDAGDVVFKDEKGLFTLTLDENGKPITDPATKAPIRTDITDPLQVAKLEHQAWVGTPPKLFANETSQGTSALGDLTKFIFNKDDKNLSSMRVQDAMSSVDGQLKAVDAKIADLDTKLAELNQKIDASKEELIELRNEIAGAECEIYEVEREVLAGIENGWLDNDDIEVIRKGAHQGFQNEIDAAIEDRDLRMAAMETDTSESDTQFADSAALTFEYNEDLAPLKSEINNQIENGAIKGETLDTLLEDASPAQQRKILADLAKSGINIQGESLVKDQIELAFSAEGAMGISASKIDMMPPRVVPEYKADAEISQALALKLKEEQQPDPSPAPSSRRDMSFTAMA